MSKAPAVASCCPEEEVIRDFLGGMLSVDRIDSIAPHFESCHSCQAKLEALHPGGDDLVSHLRNLPHSSSPSVTACPQCKSPIEDGSTAKVISCDACGSTVNLDLNGSDDRNFVGMVLNRYKIVRMVGRGGFGTVYEAEDVELKRTVAVW